MCVQRYPVEMGRLWAQIFSGSLPRLAAAKMQLKGPHSSILPSQLRLQTVQLKTTSWDRGILGKSATMAGSFKNHIHHKATGPGGGGINLVAIDYAVS